MQKYCDDFKGKRITLMGLGLLGRGVGDARLLAECGAILTVTDLKTKEELKDSIEQLKDLKNIRYVLGGHQEEDFTNAEMVLKAPATPVDSQYIKAAEDAGVHVTMSAALFTKYALETGVTVVGITGTRGKTTVAYMIYETLKQAGKSVYIAGNVRGVSTLSLLKDIQKDDIVILELDSWQLQGFEAEKISPDVAVFTNLMEDHLNYYSSTEEYLSDKAQIFLYQDFTKGDVLIVGESVYSQITDEKPPVDPIVSVPIPEEWKLKVKGVHNRENASLAREALASLGVPDSDIKNGITSFLGVEGRLELLGEKDGVKIYNDNNATTPEATIVAIKSFPDDAIILIAGGTSKGIDLNSLKDYINKNVKKLICIDSLATGTQELLKLFPNAYVADSVSGVVKKAFEVATSGDVVLFSPAFSSFGIFKNEYDRNDQFKKIIKKEL